MGREPGGHGVGDGIAFTNWEAGGLVPGLMPEIDPTEETPAAQRQMKAFRGAQLCSRKLGKA